MIVPSFRHLAKLLLIFSLPILCATANAEITSKSNEIVVVQPSNLPEQAQTPGNSCFLYSDSDGSTYLYIEQQQGARLATFDVTDPSKIKFVDSARLGSPGAFDFVRPVGGRAELIRFRDGKGVAVLELHHPKKPQMRMVSGMKESGGTEPLGESAFLMIDEPYNYVRAIPRDYQVIDISTPSDPVLIATVKAVKHEVANTYTGTTFLLGSEGLTVVRRLSVERDYKNQLQQESQN